MGPGHSATDAGAASKLDECSRFAPFQRGETHHMTSRKTQTTLRSLVAASAALIAIIAPASAQAGVLVSSATNCDDQTLSQPFLPWADVASYTLDPGGSFEAGSPPWSRDNAQVVSGNEPFAVTSGGDSRALAIANGGSATSRALCVGIEHPDIRFFAQASSPGAALSVEVLFEDAFGNVQSLPIGSLTGNTGWSLTAPYPVVANLLPLLPGDHTAVSFRFSASGGSFRIDDVYVDPYRSY